jgi:arylsulfatase A-like enzyme
MHAVDWFPTLAALVGYRPETNLQWDGINQWPMLTGLSPPNKERTIYIAMKNGSRAIRFGDWKLIVPNRGEPQLFHLAKDPFEKEDLASRQPEKLVELQALLAKEYAKDEPRLPTDLVGIPD